MTWLAFQVWNGIKSARMPRVTPKNATQAEPEAVKKSVFQERLMRVARAGRLKTTATTAPKKYLLQGRENPLVDAY